MNEGLFLTWAVSMLPIALRVLYDNYLAMKNYREMERRLASAVSVSKSTESAFKGLFKWAGRLHLVVVYMVILHYVEGVVNGVDLFGSVIIGIEVVTMGGLSYMARNYTKVTLDRYFEFDLPELKRRVKINGD